jgi:hypothetical protein
MKDTKTRPKVRRIEQPVYKRRWDEQWKVGNRWVCGQPAYDAEYLDAFDWWLSEKAEWWLEHTHKGKPVELDAWATALWSDPRVQAAWTVAAETTQRLTLWRRDQTDKPKGKPPTLDTSQPAFAKAFKTLVKDQSVPENIPYAVPWENLEKKMNIPAAVKSLRGKLNVPRERFRVTAEGLYVVAGL